MKKILKKLETIYAAVAFSEAGEFETAVKMMKEERPEKRVRTGRLERLMMAITFAEAGEHESAREIMREGQKIQKRDRITEKPRKQLRAPGIKR